MSRIRFFTAAFLIAFVIFPCISVDDDLIRLQILNINATDDDAMHAAPRAAASGPGLQLDRMLEEHNTFQVTTLYRFALAFFFSALACYLTVVTVRRDLPTLGGRAPPLFV